MVNKKWITLFRFGKIKEYPSADYDKEYWYYRFCNDLDEKSNSSLIVGILFDKKDYPNPKDIKDTIQVQLNIRPTKKRRKKRIKW